MSQKFDTSSFQPQVDSAWYAPVLEWGQSLMSFGETTAQTKPDEGRGVFFETLNAQKDRDPVNFTGWSASSHEELLASFKKDGRSKSIASKTHDVGMILQLDEDTAMPVVVALLPGGPADSCGQIRRGDYLTVIDGIITSDLLLQYVEELLSGPVDSEVNLDFARFDDEEDDPRSFSVTLMRESKRSQGESKELEGGVGIVFETSVIDGSCSIKRCVYNGPAHRSGVLENGDILYNIDEVCVHRRGVHVVAKLLFGPVGSVVNLCFLRGRRKYITVNLTRERINHHTDVMGLLRHAQYSLTQSKIT
uniref:PDZ domain-containing protein n=1 Tax=Hanusia phi TaxID=3032 RepID=A0A7S0ESU1_9CRYP